MCSSDLLELTTATEVQDAQETAAEVIEEAQTTVLQQEATETETVEVAVAEEKVETVVEGDETEAEDEAAKLEKDKSSRPRRPRGRPPKKATAGNE